MVSFDLTAKTTSVGDSYSSSLSSSSTLSSTSQRKSISNYTPPPDIIRPLTISKTLLSTNHISNNFRGLDTTSTNNPLLLSVEGILQFLFPSNLQHPLAYARLILLSLYGPLNPDDNQLYGGYKKSHKLSENEIEQMCLEVEREDILSIYTEDRVDVWNLTKTEQDLMFNQADQRFKVEKGKLSLPKITQQDVLQLLSTLPQDELGRINFHDFQYVVQEYRADRTKRNKLVFPNLGTSSTGGKKQRFTASGSLAASQTLSQKLSSSTSLFNPTSSLRSTSIPPRPLNQVTKKNIVNASIAPPTMFLKNQGQNTADRIKQNNELLNKHAYKIMTIPCPATNDKSSSNSAITSNVRLLREVSPFIPPPEDAKNRPKFNNKAGLKGAGLGSMVQSASSTSYRQKYTIY